MLRGKNRLNFYSIHYTIPSMEKFDFVRFVGGIRSLNRTLANGIIDKSELYSHNQTHADEEQEALRAKIKERNLRYVEQRRKKLEKNLHIDTSNSTLQLTKGSELASPTEQSIHRYNVQSHRSSLNSAKFIPLSPTHPSASKKPKYVPNITQSSLETNDQTISTSGTKENFRIFHSPKKPNFDLNKSSQLSSPHMREIFEQNLTSPSYRRDPSSISNLRSPRRGELPSRRAIVHLKQNSSYTSKSMKRLSTASRILDIINGVTSDLTYWTQKDRVSLEDKLNQTKQLNEYYKNMLETLGAVHEAVTSAILVLKDKVELDKYLNEILKCAQRSRNTEFNVAALKLQAKILMKYKDFYRAISNYKAIKQTSDSNIDFASQNTKANHSYLVHKLSSYKNIGKCFQDIQNYKRALFYFVKMLQTAWLLKNQQSELLAYDFIGIQYYYLGDIDKANYYHHKLIIGEGEKVDSEVRELGIQKLKRNIHEKNQTKGYKLRVDTIKSLEDELTRSSPPESEDEFELPDPMNSRPRNESKKSGQLRISTANRIKLIPLLLEQKRYENNRSLRKKTGNRTFHNSMSSTSMLFEARSQSPKPVIYLSHLSPNKNVQNFNNADSKDVVNAMVNIDKIQGNRTSSIVLDRFSLEKTKRRLEKFRDNILCARIEVEKMAEAAAEMEKAVLGGSRTVLSETSFSSARNPIKRVGKM
mgnify:FL=1